MIAIEETCALHFNLEMPGDDTSYQNIPKQVSLLTIKLLPDVGHASCHHTISTGPRILRRKVCGGENYLGVGPIEEAVFDAVVPSTLLQSCGQHQGAVAVGDGEVHVPKNDVEGPGQVLDEGILPATYLWDVNACNIAGNVEVDELPIKLHKHGEARHWYGSSGEAPPLAKQTARSQTQDN